MSNRIVFKNVAVPELDYARLRRLADLDNRTMARQVAHLIRRACEERGITVEAQADVERLRASSPAAGAADESPSES
jgi:hypothetical protein